MLRLTIAGIFTGLPLSKQRRMRHIGQGSFVGAKECPATTSGQRKGKGGER